MEKISLYQLSDAINKIEKFLEDPVELAEYLDSLQMQFNDKVDNVIRYRRSLELTQDAIESEIDRLTALKKYYATRSENLKNYVAYSMDKAGQDKIETSVVKLSFRKSDSLVVDNESLVPSEYIIIKQVTQVDKNAIKKDIKDGKEVQGVHIEHIKNLQIR